MGCGRTRESSQLNIAVFNASNTLYWMLSALFVYKLCIIFSLFFFFEGDRYIVVEIFMRIRSHGSRYLLLLPSFFYYYIVLSPCALFGECVLLLSCHNLSSAFCIRCTLLNPKHQMMFETGAIFRAG